MTAYKFSLEVRRGLGGEFLPLELEEAMRMCGEGKSVAECIQALQAKRDRKARGRA